MAIPRGLAQPARYAVLLAGGVPALAFPAPNLEFLAWFGLVPGLLLIRAAPSQREALVRGWWFGTGYLLAGLYWLIPNLGPALLLVAIVLGALWMALALALWRLLRPPVTAWRAVGALAARAQHDDIVDVSVVEGAVRRRHAVVTSNPTHIRKVVFVAGADLAIYAV